MIEDLPHHYRGFLIRRPNERKKTLTAIQILERALAGSRWLVERQNPDGSWEGLKDPKVDAFYKCCWALAETGQLASAHRSLNYVRRHFFSGEGDFLSREHPWHKTAHYPYVNSYLIVGSMLAGRYDIAMPAVDFLLSQQAGHGGFYSRLAKSGGNETADTTSSAIAGIACLAAGKIDAARKVGDYLAGLIHLQPEPNIRFFTALKSDGGLYTRIENDHEAFLRLIDTRKADQCWFAMGIPFSFLILLAGATNETRYRDLAKWFFDFQQRCVGPWDGYSSGKAGWGCAMLYRSTGEGDYRDIAMHIAEFIMKMQNSDGGWYNRGWDLTNSDFDLTAEFTLWLSLISTNILARDSDALPLAFNNIRIPKPRMALKKTLGIHSKILKNEGLKKYFEYSYYYRKNLFLNWAKKKFHLR